MSKADDLKAEYEAALEVAELEDELVKLKESGKDTGRLRAVKEELREVRRAQREEREAAGTAAPAPVKASAKVKGV